MAHERICSVCGKQYQYCKRCAQFAHMPTWYYAFCSESCKDVNMILNKLQFNHITPEEAKIELNECDLSRLEFFYQPDRLKIEKIMATPKKKTRKKETPIEEVSVEETPIDIVNEEI